VTIWHYTRWFDFFGTVVLVGGDIADSTGTATAGWSVPGMTRAASGTADSD